MQPRWFQPLVGRTALLGIEVEERGVLPADDRKIVEFVGDSITEGVLIDADYAEKPAYTWDQHNRVYQDDVTATYGWLTAEALNLRPVMMGYGAVGATRGGCGGVVKAASAYPFVYDGVPYAGEAPDYIVINHGANDRGAGAEKRPCRIRGAAGRNRREASPAPCWWRSVRSAARMPPNWRRCANRIPKSTAARCISSTAACGFPPSRCIRCAAGTKSSRSISSPR